MFKIIYLENHRFYGFLTAFTIAVRALGYCVKDALIFNSAALLNN